MRRVFLTGASGYVGSLLLERLAGLPDVERVTGVALAPPSAALPPKARFIEMDIRSAQLAEVMAGHDVVVHTACVVLWLAKMPAREREDINRNGLLNVASAAVANGVQRFVQASSVAAYDPSLVRGRTGIAEDFPLGRGSSPFYYWNTKAEAERILAKALRGRMVLTTLRPNHIIGPRNRALVADYRWGAVNFIGRNPRRQFVHEEDVASAFVLAVQKEMPGAFNVVPDDHVLQSDMWKILGRRIVPRISLGLGRRVAAVLWRYFGTTAHPDWIDDMVMDFTASNAKLKGMGWKPRFGTAEAIRSAL